MSDPGRPQAAFYCVADERYFLGAVGMVNSLRMVGHSEPIYILDAGLRPEQREALAAEARVVAGPGEGHPYLLKTVAPLRHPASVMALIDADVVVTRRLDELFERAAAGAVVALENDRDRFVPEWGELLGIGPLRRRPYLCIGLALLGGGVGDRVLQRLDELQRQVDFDPAMARRERSRHPFLYPEQDVLNAVLSAELEDEAVVSLANRLAPNPPFAGLEVRDERSLRCSYDDGIEPYALHHLARKPWLEPAYHGAYSRLLARLLVGDDVAIRIDENELPLRMRSGGRARLARSLTDVLDFARWQLTDRLPARARGRARALAGRGDPHR